MTQINNLPTVTTVNGGDAIPLFTSGTRINAKMTVAQFLEYFTDNFASPDFTTILSSPISGFNQVLGVQTSNIWLVLTPAGTLATGTITLPPAATAYDGEVVMVTTTQQITALSWVSSGATIEGEPSTLGAGGSVTLRYSETAAVWFCTTTSQGSIATFADITITGDILDVNGNIIVALSPDYVPPQDPEDIKYILIENGLSSASIKATSNTGGADLNISADGAIVIGGSDFDTTVQGEDVNVTAATGDVNIAATAGNVIADVTALGTMAVRVGGGSIFQVDATGSDVVGVANADALKTNATTVGALPAAAAGNRGQRRYVTDANAALTAGIGTVVAAGGANVVPVFSDGTNWRIG